MVSLLDDDEGDGGLVGGRERLTRASYLVHLVAQHERKLALGDAVAEEDEPMREALVDALELEQQAVEHLVQVVDHLVGLAARRTLRVEPGAVVARVLVEAAHHGRYGLGHARVARRRMRHVAAEHHDRRGEQLLQVVGEERRRLRQNEVLAAELRVDLEQYVRDGLILDAEDVAVLDGLGGDAAFQVAHGLDGVVGLAGAGQHAHDQVERLVLDDEVLDEALHSGWVGRVRAVLLVERGRQGHAVYATDAHESVDELVDRVDLLDAMGEVDDDPARHLFARVEAEIAVVPLAVLADAHRLDGVGRLVGEIGRRQHAAVHLGHLETHVDVELLEDRVAVDARPVDPVLDVGEALGGLDRRELDHVGRLLLGELLLMLELRATQLHRHVGLLARVNARQLRIPAQEKSTHINQFFTHLIIQVDIFCGGSKDYLRSILYCCFM